jgi:hypothetical protein
VSGGEQTQAKQSLDHHAKKKEQKKGQTGLSKASAQRRTFSTKIFFKKNCVFFDSKREKEQAFERGIL